MAKPDVILIGGAPGAGKTTLGRALATRLDAAWLTVDDLSAAVTAVTTPESHPELHNMTRAVTGLNSAEYFTTRPVDQLIADANAQHEAVWPAVQGVIRKRAASGPRIVIDGWYFRPEMVAKLDLENVISFWLVVDREVLHEREQGQEFYALSADPERMLQNFLGRSYWYNDLIRQQAEEFNFQVLHQGGTVSVEQMCTTAMKRIDQHTASTLTR